MRGSRDHVRFLSELWVGLMKVLFLTIRLVDNFSLFTLSISVTRTGTG